MKRSIAIILMTTTVGAALGTASAALAAVPGGVTLTPTGAHGRAIDDIETPRPDPRPADDSALTLISDEGDEDDDGWSWSSGGDDDDDDCSDDDDDADCAGAGSGTAAPAGPVTPPKNGLFTDGTTATVTTN